MVPKPLPLNDNIFREDAAPGLVIEMELNKVYHSTTSPFQQVQVVDTYFGRTLITDGKTQSAQFDEYAYHESLVHPPMLQFAYNQQQQRRQQQRKQQVASKNNDDNDNDDVAIGAKTVFIGGGGELATAREVLKHKSVEKVIMVDLDEVVVDASVEYLPEWGGNSVKEDPRFELIIGDAYAYLMDCTIQFDVIIMDLSDPIEAGPGVQLYTKELYQHAASLLNPNGGVFVTQSGTADVIPPPHLQNHPNGVGETHESMCFGPIRNTLALAFPFTVPYSQSIPSFGGDWGFVMASASWTLASGDDNDDDGSSSSSLILGGGLDRACAKVVDNLIESQLKGGENSLKMYDGITHQRMFSLTKALRKHLAKDDRIMTLDNPIFTY